MERLQHHPPEQQGEIVRQLNAPDANEQSSAAFEASGMQYNEWLENGGYQGYLKRQEATGSDAPTEELPEVAPESEAPTSEVAKKHTRTRTKEHMTRAQALQEITKATTSSEKTDDVATKNDWKIEKEFTYSGVDNKSTKKGDRVVSVRSESDPTKTELLTVDEAKERGIYNQATTELAKKQQAILTSKEAQDVFAEGGEEAYQEYVKSKLAELETGDQQSAKPGKEIELYTGDKPTSEPGPEEDKPGKEIELYRSPADRAKELLRDVDPASLEVMGRALNNYVKLAAQRERRAVTANKYSEKEVESARQEYESIRREVKQSVLSRLKAAGLGPSEVELISILDDGSEARALKSAIAFEAKQLAGMGEQEGKLQQMRGNFLDWWSEQGGNKLFSKAGLKGRAKKAGVMATLGFVPGVAAGVAGATVAGPFIGAAVAAGAATGVARGLMGAKLNRAAEGRTKIDAQVERRLTDQALAIDRADHSKGGAHEVSEAFRDGTEREVQRNRKRLAAAAGAGAVFGALGAGTGQWLQDRINIPGGGGTPEAPTETPTEVVPPEAPVTPEVQGDSFTVEYGNGITHEILDYANAQGKTVSPERAYEIYEQLHNEFNRDIIDLAGTANDSYMQGSEVRISNPGQAQWFPEVETRLRELLEEADDSSS